VLLPAPCAPQRAYAPPSWTTAPAWSATSPRQRLRIASGVVATGWTMASAVGIVGRASDTDRGRRRTSSVT
jgi:hypothetical protein